LPGGRLRALNRTAGAAEDGAARRYLQKATYEVLDVSLPEALPYREAMNHGASLSETSEKKLNTRAQALVDELAKRVKSAAAARAGHTRKERAR
jgi:hypothetical protein